jgi:hypothetical protein
MGVGSEAQGFALAPPCTTLHHLAPPCGFDFTLYLMVY